MRASLRGFRTFIEAEVNSLDGKGQGKSSGKPENMLDAQWREFGIDPNSIPDRIESGHVEIDGVSYNQSVWEVKKPIHLTDKFVRVRMVPPDEVNSPSLNQHGYKNGVSYLGATPTGWRPITIDKLAEMLGKPLQQPAGGAAPGGMGGLPPM